MNPQATPYDITDIPYFPYVPGAQIWSGFFLFACVVFLGWKAFERWSYRSNWRTKAYALALRDLKGLEKIFSQNLENQPVGRGDQQPTSEARLGNAKEVLGKASSIAKRFVSLVEGTDLTSMSARELHDFANRKESPLSALVETLVQIDSSRYDRSLSVGIEVLREIVDTLEQYHNQLRDSDQLRNSYSNQSRSSYSAGEREK